MNGRRLYIYYRVPAPDADACCADARAVQNRLTKAHPGLHAELLRRPEADGQNLATLMETYAHADGIDDALQALIEAEGAAALGARCIGERHTEVFAPACAS